MSNIDSLSQWYRQKAVRSLPRHDAITGPHSAEPPPSWGDRAVCLGALVIFVWLVLSLVLALVLA